MADLRLPEGRHPGWPARLGPLLVAAGTLELRPPRLRDASAWSSTRQRDRAHLEQWEPSGYGQDWDERNSLLAWPPQWAALRSLGRRGLALPFIITVNGRLAGQVTVGNIQRGALRSGWIGYWVASDLTRGGVATAAAALLADHSFGPAGLHRLEATVRPENEPSLRVLDKLGFRREGLHQRYLDIGGTWRDHYSLALTEEEIGSGVVDRLVRRGLARIP